MTKTLTEDQKAYWLTILKDTGTIDPEETEIPEGDEVPAFQKWAVVFDDNANESGQFVATFDKRADLLAYVNEGTVYDDTNSRGDGSDWQVFQIHDLENMSRHWFRQTLDIGPVVLEGESEAPRW